MRSKNGWVLLVMVLSGIVLGAFWHADRTCVGA